MKCALFVSEIFLFPFLQFLMPSLVSSIAPYFAVLPDSILFVLICLVLEFSCGSAMNATKECSPISPKLQNLSNVCQ